MSDIMRSFMVRFIFFTSYFSMRTLSIIYRRRCPKISERT
ncbi:hypothetical protein Mhar_1631 [Methanothrix harundinacea 6Ac]|uniref:Uncharacterized protein n=1 Tax=Methanothrix harundinacea (strain 6Ac) TaxID=1110509 RepID=G7WPW0_METH6|nr:hypothetical protein Mhar_1631 [Methanothrix harundinacea 6Ac]